MHATFSGPQRSKTLAPLPNTAARLLDLEEMLIEQLRLLGGASYRRRLEIELELSEVRRDLQRLGFSRSK
jgi:hypothetical protein